MATKKPSTRARRKAEQEQVVKSTRMKDFLGAGKVETKVITPVERMLLQYGDGEEERSQDVLHVSELASSSFCPRAAFLRITGVPAKTVDVRMRLQAILEEGHDIHAKWQRWIRRLGRLYGRWDCAVCDHKWLATSPENCPNCSAPGWKISYREVPLDRRKEYFIVGSGDAQLDGPDGIWVEAKSIGVGTVRIEVPRLLSKYTHKGVHLEDLDLFLEWLTGKHREAFLAGKPSLEELGDIPKSYVSGWVDFDGLWKDIHRPFPPHLRQGHLYGFLAGVEEVIFIYEFKPNQAYKEFIIRPGESVYGPMIEAALDVKWAVEKDRPPRCVHDNCAQCKVYEKENDGTASSPQARQAQPAGDNQGHRSRVRRANTSGESGTRKGRALSARETGVRVSTAARGSNGVVRRPVDGGVLPVHGLGRLLGRTTRADGGG